jgi:uncharacterized protein YwqG
MTPEEIVTKLEPWLARQRRPAWKPVVEEGDDSVAGSKFCGIPWIGPDASWPECGHCKQPLTLFLQLDLNDLPRELGWQFGSGLLQLFYCTRDDCQGMGGWEPFADVLSRVRIVLPTGPSLATSVAQQECSSPAKRIAGWREVTDLPMPSEHDQLGLKYTYDFDAGTLRIECPELHLDVTNPMNDCEAEQIAISEVGDKLAGWPAWVQGVEYPHCLKCGRQMVHIFQVDSEDNIPFMFVDVGCGHITQCPEHKEIVAFGWACS